MKTIIALIITIITLAVVWSKNTKEVYAANTINKSLVVKLSVDKDTKPGALIKDSNLSFIILEDVK